MGRISQKHDPIKPHIHLYLQLFVQHKRLLSFGVLLTLFSSLGQTFLLSLFVPYFTLEFGLSKTMIGVMFSGATLISALLLFKAGKLIDSVPLRKYVLIVSFGLLSSAFIMFSAVSIPMLFLGLVGLRLSGQGLLAHTSETTMARYFDHMRGKALSVASMGYALGEAIMPILLATLLTLIGWRLSWLVLCGMVLLILIPMIWFLLDVPLPAHSLMEEASTEPKWTQSQVLRDYRYFFLLPGFVTAPFLLTGFFLYQLPLALQKGWTAEWIATSFIAFAASRSLSSLVSGPLVDRYTARSLYSFTLVPMMLGMFILGWSDAVWVAPVYLGLAGLTMGAVNSMKSAVTAELYGVTTLGAVRSLNASFTILAAATAPLLFGLFMDAGWPLYWLTTAATFLLMSGFLATRWVIPRYAQKHLLV